MRQAVHALQHFYMLPILSLYWISSILNPTCITVTVEATPTLYICLGGKAGFECYDFHFLVWLAALGREAGWSAV